MLVAWIWSLLWYLALDPLKWALAWVLNENGMRSSSTWRLDQVCGAVQLCMQLVHVEKGREMDCKTLSGHMVLSAREDQQERCKALQLAGHGLA